MITDEELKDFHRRIAGNFMFGAPEMERVLNRLSAAEAERDESDRQSKEWADEAIAATARAQAVEADVYQPGIWRCAKCGFRLVQSNLNANNGSITARNDPGEKCPNDGANLWRVTWREDAEAATKWGEEQFDKRQAAEARNRELVEALRQAREKLQIECGGQRPYNGGVPTQDLFPRIDALLKDTQNAG